MIDEGVTIGFDDRWTGSFHGPSAFVVRDGLLHPVGRAVTPDLHVPGTLFPRLTDHHVHLGLADAEQLMPGGITAVIDLGWVPEEAARWHTEASFPGSTLPEVRVAGGFLTCADGYPLGRPWAPDAAVVQLSDPSRADAAVRAQVRLGASVIKTTFNSTAGPVPSPELAAAIVTAARAHGVPVAAHVEGTGMTARALDAGVNVLAHTPFSERLDAELIARISRAGTAIISTLDIHGWGERTTESEIATANLRHLVAAGARVRYGTDLGNGPLPAGVNVRELSALAETGLERDALVAAIAGTALPEVVGPRFAWAPGVPPAEASEAAIWLATARATTVDYLEETLA